MNKLLRKWDILIIAAAAVLSIALILFVRGSGKGRIAEISVDGRVVETIDLDSVKERREIVPDTAIPVTIVAEDGGIYFESSECPDKICVKTGRLTDKGDTAICLPARTVISITGADVDVITY